MQSEDNNSVTETDQNKSGIKGLIARFDKHPKDDKHISTYPHPLKKAGDKAVPIEHHQIHHVHHEVVAHPSHHHEPHHPVVEPVVEAQPSALSVKDRIAQLQKQQSQTQNKTIQPKNTSGTKEHPSSRHFSQVDIDKIVKDDTSPYQGRYQSMHVASNNNEEGPSFNEAVNNFLKVMTDEQKDNHLNEKISEQSSTKADEHQQSKLEQALQNSKQWQDEQKEVEQVSVKQEQDGQNQKSEPEQLQKEVDKASSIQSEIVQSQIIFVPSKEEGQSNLEQKENTEQGPNQLQESSDNPMLESLVQVQQEDIKEEIQEPLLSSFIVSVQEQEGVFRISEQKVIQTIEKHNIDIEKELTDDNHHLWTVTDKNGQKTIYQGQIIDGVRTGHGREIQHDGTYYQGQYARNLPNGEGIIVYFDGDCYFGSFFDGKKQGVGTYIHTDRETYQGEWFDDLQEGKGFQTLKDGSTYEGEFKLGRRNGKGTYTYNKTTYIGDFVDDKKHGQGDFIWADGKRYRGGWENNLKHGSGVMIDCNGNETPGEWIEGVKRKV